MNNKGKIFHIPRRFVKEEWGGIETVIIETSRELIKAGYDVEIFTSLALSKKKHELIFDIPVRRFSYFYPRLGLKRNNKLLLDKRAGNVLSFPFLFSLLFTKNITVFHLHAGGTIAGFVRFISKLRKIPYVTSIHGGLMDLPQKQLDAMVAPMKGSLNYGKILDFIIGSKKNIQDADAIICVGEKERDLLKEKYPIQKVVYIPNGVDIEKFSSGNSAEFRKKHQISKNEKILLCVSGFYSQKNQLLLVDAFEKIKQEIPDIKLVLIGVVYDRQYYEEIQKKISDKNLEDSVILLANIEFDDSTLFDAYSACDLFVLPSKYETFGIVILEAWSAGKPIICAKVGGLASFVEDNENGCFFDDNSAEDLSVKIMNVIKNKELSKKLSQNAYKSVKNFSWQKITKKLIELYEEISK